MSWRDNRSFWFKTLVVIVGVLCKNWRNIAWDKQDRISVLRACHFIRDATSSYRAVWGVRDYSVNTTGGQKRKHLWCQDRSKKADESKGTRFSGTVKCRHSWTSGIFNCCWLLHSLSGNKILFPVGEFHATRLIQLNCPTTGLCMWLRPGQSEYLTALAMLIGSKMDLWLHLANHKPPETLLRELEGRLVLSTGLVRLKMCACGAASSSSDTVWREPVWAEQR